MDKTQSKALWTKNILVTEIMALIKGANIYILYGKLPFEF